MIPGGTRPQPWRVVLTFVRRLVFVVTAVLLLLTFVTGSKTIYQYQFLAFMSLMALAIAGKMMEPEKPEEPDEVVDPVYEQAKADALRELDEMEALARGDLPEPKKTIALAPSQESWRRLREYQQDPEKTKRMVAEEYQKRLARLTIERQGAEFFDVYSNDGTWLQRYEMPKAGYFHEGAPPQLPRKVYDHNDVKTYTGPRSGGGASA